MANINKLNVGGNEYELRDARISTGTGAPSGGSNGDIYFQRGDNVVHTQNGWSWTIGANGLCRLWREMNIGNLWMGSGSYGGTWGDAYFRDKVVWNAAYPITFKETPAVFWVPECDSYNLWIFSDWESETASTTMAPGCGCARYGSAQTSTSVKIYYLVIGLV